MEPLATTDELAEKLSFVMSEGEEREATRVLEELSDDARHYGSDTWVDSASSPTQVIRLVVKAAARHMKNYEGFTTSRAGDETVAWADRGEAMGDAQFTATEIARLREYGGNYEVGLQTVDVYAYQTKHRPKYDTRLLTGDGFPYFNDPEHPW